MPKLVKWLWGAVLTLSLLLMNVPVMAATTWTTSYVTPQIAAGEEHTVALSSDGTVWAWGFNGSGQVGDAIPRSTTTPVPVKVQGLSDITSIAAGYSHTLALKSNGTVWGVGANASGQLGIGTYPDWISTPVQVSGLSGVVAIAAGSLHSIALKNDGTVWVWGHNLYGQLGNGTTSYSYSPVQVPSLSNVIAIASNSSSLNTVVLKSDGTVWAWGYNFYGQLGNGTTTNSHSPVQVGSLDNVQAIANAYTHTIALKGDGTVWVCGNNGQSVSGRSLMPVQVTGLSEVSAIAAGFEHTVALMSDSTVRTWRSMDTGMAVQTTLSDVSAIAAARNRVVALKNDNSIWTYGYNGNGELGNGTFTDSNLPVPVVGFGPISISGTPPAVVNIGSFYNFAPTTSNATSHSITGEIPVGLNFNAITGTLSGTPTTAGTYTNIVISATNSTGTVSLPAFSITVALSMPTISGIPPTTNTAGSSYSFVPTSTNATSFSITSKPYWASFDTATGVLSGAPTSANVGTYPNIVITATNSTGSVSLPAFSITVALPMPTISGTPATTGTAGLLYYFIPSATNATSFSITNKPSWANFDATTGALTGSLVKDDAGSYTNIIIRATNTTGTVALPAFSIAVSLPMPGSTVWQQTRGPEGGIVQALAIDPSDDQNIFAGTSGGGVFKSTNGGSSWSVVDNGITARFIYALAIDQQNSQTIVAGTGGGGVFKSTNGGSTWSAVNHGLAGMEVRALAIDPSNSQIFYAGTSNYGLFKSTNGGETWTSANSGLASSTVFSLAFDPINSQTIYAGTWGGVFKSTNGGTSWTGLNNGPKDILLLSIDMHSPQTIYAGTLYNGVFKSTDAGVSWNAVNSGIAGMGVKALTIDPSNSETLYVGTAGGIYKSTDGATSWRTLNTGLTNIRIGSLAINPKKPQTIFAGTDGDGVFRTINSGSSWNPVNGGLIASAVYALANDPSSQTVYAGGYEVMSKSTDGGISWGAVTNGLGISHVYTLVIDPSNSQTLYAGGSGNGLVAKSNNGGTSWSVINSGVTVTNVFALAIDPNNTQTLYAGGNGGGVLFKSTNGGTAWEAINNGLSSTSVGALAIAPNNSQTLYAGTGAGIFKSTDGGISWGPMNSGLPSTYVNSLVIDPTTDQTIYAGTNGGGVFKSTNGGSSWSAVNSGLTDTIVVDLAIDPSNSDVIYAVTWPGGVSKSTNGGGSWSAVNNGLTNMTISGGARSLIIDESNTQALYLGSIGGGVFKGLSELAVLTISGTPVTAATVGTAYNFTPTSTSATNFSVTENVPPGLNFNTTTGVLSGNPTTTGTYSNIIITATNATGSASLPAFTITVSKGTPTVTTLPTATGITFGQALLNSTLRGGVASVPGSFAFTNPSAVPSVSGNYSASVTFTPADFANYNVVTTIVNVAVTSAAVNGTCGSSHRGVFNSIPSANLCSSGSANAVSGSGPWSWRCDGVNGGGNVPCSASKHASTLPVVITGPPSVDYTGGKLGTVFTVHRKQGGSSSTTAYTGSSIKFTDTAALKPNTIYQYTVTSDADPSETVVTTVRTSLYNGWNIIAVPFDTAGVAPGTLFGSPVSAVYQWVPTGATAESSSSVLGSYSTVNSLVPGNGYFVKASNSSTVLVHSGNPGPSSATVVLKPGWTMIANPVIENKTNIASNWLIDGNPLGDAIVGNKIGGGLYWWNGTTYDSWSIVNQNPQIEPWKGYWILNLDTVNHTLTIQ